MSKWLDPTHGRNAAVVALAAELADPVRLTVLQLLAAEGPQSATRLAEFLDIAPTRLANHLARLRDAGLVIAARSGRHVTYRVTDARLRVVLDTLAGFTTATDQTAIGGGGRRSPLEVARTCYQHAAGLLGVAILDDAVRRGAVTRPETDSVELAVTARAQRHFARIGVDLSDVRPGRRRLAAGCLDWTERRPHLAGALGDAVLDALVAQGFVRRQPATRALAVTASGRRTLPRLVPTFDV